MARDGHGTLRVWSTESFEEISVVHGERAFIEAEFDPLGGRVVASNGTRTVRMYDLFDGTLLENLTSPFLHTGLRWSQDGSRLASLSTTKYAPVWYMVQRKSAPNTYTNLGAPTELLRAGGRTFVLHENGVLATWELETGAISAVDTGVIGGVRGMSKAAVGGEVLIWGEGGLGRLDVARLELRWSLETEHPVASAQGDEVTGAGLNEEGHAFSWSEDAILKDLGPAGCVAVSPGGEWIATAGDGVEVTLRSSAADVEDRTLSFEGMTKAPVTIFELLFHPTGGVLYVNTSERRIRMFQVDTGEEVGIARGVQLRDIRNSSDGKQILGTPGDRRFARLLDSVTGKILRDNETHHEADVLTSDLDKESSFAVTGSADGVLQVWRVDDGEAHWFHESGRGPVADVVFWGSGPELGVLAASRDGFLWGVPVYPLNSVDEHGPEPLGSWIAHEETRYAQPFSYHPPIKSSGFSE
jgi:WD40 repeat protein